MIRYYILFENNEQSWALHRLLDEAGVLNRIVPAPAAARGELSCGSAILIRPEEIDAAREVINSHGAAHHSIVSLDDPLRARRDRYC